MKLLLDMNLPPAWAPRFCSEGFEALHWTDVGPGNASDTAVMAWAKRDGRVVVTQDLDFGAILAATGAAGPSVVQIRADDLIGGDTFDRVLAALRQVRLEIERGALVTVDIFRTRIRLLPISD